MTLRPYALIALALALPLQLAADDLPGLPGLPAAGGYAQANDADQLVKLQAKVDELLAQAKGVREGEDRLTASIERLMNATGVRFGGQGVMHSVAFTTFPTQGSSPVPNKRSWPSVGYFDFTITAKPRPELSAEVTYRMEKVFGGYWGSLDISGVRRFNLHGETSIGFDAGDFNYKHTPLTLWANEDQFPYEIDALARKRSEGMSQMYLGENTWPLQGLRLDGTLVLFDSVELALEGIGVRTAIAGTKNTGLAGIAVLFPFDQYLVGATAGWSLKDSKAFKLGMSYFEIIESVDTSILPSNLLPSSQQLRNNVAGADLELQLLGEEVVLKGEAAISNYTYDYGRPVTWTTGGGGNAEVVVKGKMGTFKAHGLYVDERFINYAAQTRVQDSNSDVLGQVPTSNNLLDPHDGDYSLISVTNNYFTTFNNVIFATNQGKIIIPAYGAQQLGGVYIKPGERNRALPYGWATPNRGGYGADIDLNFLDGALKPSGFYGSYAEPYEAYYIKGVGPRKYNRFGGGLKFDLAPMTGLPILLSGGWVYEDTKADSVVAYATQQGDFNIQWQAFKNVFVIGGWEQIIVCGLDYPYASVPLAPENISWVHTIQALGVDWRISKNSDIYFSYVHHDIWQPWFPAFSAGAEEFETKMSLRF